MPVSYATRRARRRKKREFILHSDAATMAAIDDSAINEALRQVEEEMIHGRIFYLYFIYPTVFNDGIHFGRMQYKNYF